MSKKKEQTEPIQEETLQEETEQEQTEQESQDVQEQTEQPSELDAMKDSMAQQEDRFLRLAAEYDNYRKRTAKEKESIWTEAKADTAGAFLPVYDNLERALKQDTADEAYKKGVEMTMNQLKEVLTKLGITEIPALGQPFDPNLHNCIGMTSVEGFESGQITLVMQRGYSLNGRVIRPAMVQTEE